ncbi:hypothetical protein SHEWT2_03635 [Shewanella hafniensis]|nr:hypothetical protein [Shewanella putrefaciens]CAD6365748.1 hypothetical protein SHEWT2_03635 [Shewanella hafniensis]
MMTQTYNNVSSINDVQTQIDMLMDKGITA